MPVSIQYIVGGLRVYLGGKADIRITFPFWVYGYFLSGWQSTHLAEFEGLRPSWVQ